MKLNRNWQLPCTLAGSLLLTVTAYSQVTFTAENPGIQTTTVAGATIENFESLSPGAVTSYSSSIGTFTGGEIVAANKFGGAGGTGNYFAVGSESGTTSATLTFSSPQDYLGMWWSAGDSGNVLKFYDGTTLLSTFNVGSIIPSLTSAYYGNPNSAFLGQDLGEPFEYLDFTGVAGQQFTSVEIDNASTGTGFEVDNLAISDTVTTPPGHPVPTIPDTANTGALFVSAVTALFGFARSRFSGRNS
jgi:hypothetical protein